MEIRNWKLEISGDILLVDKPKGITSFDVIRILRKKFGIRKMGHAGTLDPMASGLMIIGVNEGTKKMSEFLKLPKVYIADVLLGKKTDTGDMEGRVIEEKEVLIKGSGTFNFQVPTIQTKEQGEELKVPDPFIYEVVAGLVGKHSLPVPMYSAIKIGGRPLYKLARKKEKGGELTEVEKNITPPVKEMEVISARLLEIKGNVLIIEMEVSSGTYVRTLGEELGRRLGCPATLAGLRRTKIGEFLIWDAMTIEK